MTPWVASEVENGFGLIINWSTDVAWPRWQIWHIHEIIWMQKISPAVLRISRFQSWCLEEQRACRITLPLAPHSAFITWQRTRHRYHRISSCKVFWSHQNGCDVSKDEQENTSHKRSRVLYSTIPTFSVFNEASQTIPTLLSKWWFLMVAIWTAVVGPRFPARWLLLICRYVSYPLLSSTTSTWWHSESSPLRRSFMSLHPITVKLR